MKDFARLKDPVSLGSAVKFLREKCHLTVVPMPPEGIDARTMQLNGCDIRDILYIDRLALPDMVRFDAQLRAG